MNIALNLFESGLIIYAIFCITGLLSGVASLIIGRGDIHHEYSCCALLITFKIDSFYGL